MNRGAPAGESFMIRVLLLAAALALPASLAISANTMPLSPAWNIAPSGTAASSGELLFRVTPADGGDATEVTVYVLSGTNDTGVASNIRRALNSQLRTDRFNVEPGEGANVLLTSNAKPGFSLELVDSDVENVRVSVQSAAPVAPPTVPKQATPANPPPPSPSAPTSQPSSGDALPPLEAVPPADSSQPAAPPPANSPAAAPATSGPTASPTAPGSARPGSAPPGSAPEEPPQPGPPPTR
jgi:hypothetical protein